MHPDEPSQSRLAQTDSSVAGRPSTEQPEPPRLGILHLMVLTACVALHLGLTQVAGNVFSVYGSAFLEPLPPGFDSPVAGTLDGIGGGAALAGLLLLVARRRRGFVFPTHPGEYLLVLMGFNFLIGWGFLAYACLLAAYLPSGADVTGFGMAFVLPLLVFYVSVFVWVVLRTQVRRWRMFLLAIPATWALSLLLFYLAGYRFPSVWRFSEIATAAPELLISIVLVIVVLKDHLDGRRYPWTHWFGVATRFWLDMTGFAVTVGYALLAQGGPAL